MEDNSITFNRMRSLLRGLPRRGAYIREVLYKGAEWGNSEELLAQIAELLDQSNRLYYGAHRSDLKDPPVWSPLQIQRPWLDDTTKMEPLRGDELVAAFTGLVDHDENPIVEYRPTIPEGVRNN